MKEAKKIWGGGAKKREKQMMKVKAKKFLKDTAI